VRKLLAIALLLLIGCEEPEPPPLPAREVSIDGDNVFGIEDTARLTDPVERYPCELLHRWPASLPTIAEHPEFARGGYDACVFAILDSLRYRIIERDDSLAKVAWARASEIADGVISEVMSWDIIEMLAASPAPVAEWIVANERAGDTSLRSRLVWECGTGGHRIDSVAVNEVLARNLCRSVERNREASLAQRRAARELRRHFE
jgi:hypothetical protein